LASLALFGLGIFGPGIATGLVSGAPQLGAGAAAGTLLGAGGFAVAGGAATVGAARLATGAAGTSVRAASSMVRGARSVYSESASASGASGARAMGAGLAGVGRAGAESVGNAFKQWARQASSSSDNSTDDGCGSTPGWAQRLQRRQHVERGVSTATQTLRSGERGGSGANPSLREEE
jgi:type IV secretion system protein TrbL